MTRDHYATLGVTPSSEDVVIRAAYHALMRRYHPDLNPGPNGETKVREITEAYAALRDPQARAEYDLSRSVGDPILAFELGQSRIPPPAPPAARTASMAAIGIAALAVLLAWNTPRSTPAHPVSEIAVGGDRASSSAVPTADTRTPDPRPPAPALVARSTRPAAERNTMLEEVAELPLALPRAEQPTAGLAALRSAPPRAAAAPRQPARPEPAPACAGVQCTSDRLVALETHQAMLFTQSVSSADDVRRSQLHAARADLVSRRGDCRSEACVADAYLHHFREIAAIMENGAAAKR